MMTDDDIATAAAAAANVVNIGKYDVDNNDEEKQKTEEGK